VLKTSVALLIQDVLFEIRICTAYFINSKR